MNELLKLLTGGDLRSDGRADDVADEVIKNPHLFDKLIEGMSEADNIVRARTSHALEKISRSNPEMLYDHLSKIIETANKDQVPMVKWHLAMILGNLAVFKEQINLVTSALFQLLEDPSVFVRGWSIVSLGIIGRKYPGKRGNIIRKIRPLQNDKSIAIRTKVAKAMNILENEEVPMPAGWLKSKCLR